MGTTCQMDRAWRSSAMLRHTYFGARPDIVGQSATLDGTPSTIIGSLAHIVHFALRGLSSSGCRFRAVGPYDTNRSCHNLLGVARLKDGVTIDDARAQMSAIAAARTRYPTESRSERARRPALGADRRRHPAHSAAVPERRARCCWRLRASTSSACCSCGRRARKRELAVRSTLGASNGRLIRQFVTEAFVLVALGVGGGLLAAAAASGCCSASCPRTCVRGCRFSTRSA